MIQLRRLAALLVAVLPLLAGDPPWAVSSPEKEDLDRVVLDAARAELAARHTKSFLVVRNGRIAYEWYAADHAPDKPHYTASLAKALVGGMSLLLALDDGRMQPDDLASKYIPAWRGDSLKSKITIRQLATHTSGLEDAESNGIPHMELPGWKGLFWRKEPDPFQPALRDAPVVFEPGTDYAYSNPGMAALAYAVTASLRGSPEADIRTLLRERIMEPAGVTADEWEIGYGQTYSLDGLDLQPNWGGGSFTARAVARVGQLMLQRGVWGDRVLLTPSWVDRATAYAGMPLPPRPPDNPQPGSGLAWYTNFDGVWPQVPRDALAGAGAGQQVLLVVPSLGLVIVRNGGLLADSGENGFWGGIEEYVFNPVMKAVQHYSPGRGLAEPLPYPPSPVIRNLRFGKKESIVREAKGSDNWPLTWADDGNLYTAYGDGWGFEHHVPQKLSLGFARITGPPTGFHGVNIRSATGEQVGQGPAGKKASGILFLDGRLYLWVRNAGNSQLAWSDDYGQTWEWSDWRFAESFGHPSFLNYGKNYSGAPDDYVYVYSPDSGNAYEPADQMVLARVPKDRILNRESYEFFSGLKENKPSWTGDISRRTEVFTNPSRCYRSSISYNAPLQRYLWVQIFPEGSPRFYGGIAVFDAPDPWGPWTTVLYRRYFDVGPGENAHFPAKWMSGDGRTMYMVSSGDDHFSVRRVEIVLSSEP